MFNNGEKSTGNRKAGLKISFSEFDIPPIQDILLIGKLAPVGPEAVKRMVDALAPGQYEIVTVKDSHIEAVAIKTTIFNLIPRKILLDIILEEGKKITSDNSLLKAKLDIIISVFKEVDL